MAGEWRSIPAHSGLPKINLLLTSDPGEIDDFLQGWEGRYHFGLDLEWKPGFQKGAPPNRSALLSICNGPWVLAIDLLPWRKKAPEPLCDVLWNFLENEEHTFYGMGLAGDLARLAFEFDCVCDGVDFTLRAWKHLEPLKGGLTGLANRVLGTSVEQSKSVTRSNWEMRPLSEKQVLYLAEDAYLSWKLASKMLTQCEDEMQPEWLVSLAEMYGNGQVLMRHKIFVANAVHDWTSAHDEWLQKQEEKKNRPFPGRSHR